MKRHLIIAWIISIFLTACASGEGGAIVLTEFPNTPLPDSVAKPADRITAYIGPITPEQENYLATDADYLKKKAKLETSFNYWGAPNATNRPFDVESTEVRDRPIFSSDGTVAIPGIEALMGDNQWHTYTVPYADFLAATPWYPEDNKTPYEITTGQGPLELTSGKNANEMLGVDAKTGNPVRYDENTGEIKERMDKKGKWVAEGEGNGEGKVFEVCKTREQAKSCVITQEEFDNNTWFDSIVKQDKGGFDKEKVVFYPLMETQASTTSGPGSVVTFIGGLPDMPSPDVLYSNPSSRFCRELGWGFIEIDAVNHYGYPVVVFQYLNPNDTVVTMKGITGTKVELLQSTEFILPYISFEDPADSRNNPNVTELLKKWINTSVDGKGDDLTVPLELEGETVWIN